MLDLTKLDEAVRHENGVSRRLFLAYAASLSSIPLLGRRSTATPGSVRFADFPFSLGVASGDPTDTGVVLWTKLAPKPFEPGGGMPRSDVEVTWEIASDDRMRDIVSRGTAMATERLGHSVHVEANQLAPDRWYWYRFRVGDADSPIGRTRTTPPADAAAEKLRFAIASCQHFESGYFTAYEHMANEELDLVFHLGDYIYEYAGEEDRLRRHLGGELQTLDDYRVRHSQYKSDPLLQAMHARCPWTVTWDDHELANDCAGEFCQDIDPAKFLIRRAAAYQAYYEMMPLRQTSVPRGPDMRLYRPISFGQLAEFLVLDTRQYRTKQPHGGDRHDIDEAAMSPAGTILGAEQKRWLQTSLERSPARWNVLAQQVLMAMVDAEPGDEREYSMEKWSGYAHDRVDVMKFIEEHNVSNPVVLTGDIHSNWVCDLRVDDRQPEMPVVATEFAGTSISSSGDGEDSPRHLPRLLRENPHVKFHNCQRGYVVCTVTPETWQSDFRVVEKVTEPNAPIKTRASYVIEDGRAGAQEA